MSDLAERMSDGQQRASRSRRNWSLYAGGFLVAIILLLAIFGPSLAPVDPRESHLIIKVGDRWLKPPYPAFTPGFPLGSDNLGRDLYSWLLWSIRPTMILVTIVAGLRLILGIAIGVSAGWSDRWPGRLADVLISGALAVPTLIAALIVITAVGFQLGVWAFVVGLAATGWAEAAQLVRERTRTVRGQEAVEAARALGASGSQVFLLHILPQVMPMVWMLLAFEISQTLVTTAGLGFLGYYLGGAVFTEVDDFVYQRISEMPELGQMLATAWMVLDEPWAMVAAGTVVFIVVLAFNLVGEGLQARLSRKLGGARIIYLKAAGDVIPWIQDRIAAPLTGLVQNRVARAGALVVLLLLVSAGAIWMHAQQTASAVPTSEPTTIPTESAASFPATEVGAGESSVAIAPALEVAGAHLWANEGHDPWQTRWVAYSGPVTSTLQWSYEIDGKFTGGPAIDAAGDLFIAARPDGDRPGVLYALKPDGSSVWEAELADEPVGSPALAPDGTIYVADRSGMSAVSPQGEVLWHYASEDGKPATAGPIADLAGGVYYKSLSGLVALTSEGALRWSAPITESATTLAPRLSPDGIQVYWNGLAFQTANGEPVVLDPLPGAPGPTPDQIVIGADGKRYWRYGVQMLRADAGDAESPRAKVFDWSEVTWQGLDAGVTPAGRPWLSARPSIGGMGLGFYWGTQAGEISSKLNIPSMRTVRVVGVDAQDVAYICMDSYETESACVAFGPDSDRPLWRQAFRGTDALSGASLAPDRLYVATWDGELMALGGDGASGTPDAGTQAATDGTAVPFPESLTFGPAPVWDQPPVPGGNLWPMNRRDAWGTLWADFAGPQDAVVSWTFDRKGGFSGSPVVAADGSLYVGALSGHLLSLDSAGTVKWEAGLSGPAVGTPAIGGDGTIYVTDQGGYLSAFSPSGEAVWRYHPTGVITETYTSASGQVLREDYVRLDGLGPAGAGPMVAPDGTVYYSIAVDTFIVQNSLNFRSELMIAVSPSGEGLLNPPPYTWSGRVTPRLSTDGHWVVWGDFGLAATPAVRDTPGVYQSPYFGYIQTEADANRDTTFRVVTGADGYAYMLEGRTLFSWYLTTASLERDRVFEWSGDQLPGTAIDGGATPDGTRWLFFRSGRFIWITGADQILGPARFPLESTLMALDADDHVYGCGSSMGRAPECMAFSVPAAGEVEPDPQWHVTLDDGEKIVGGALAPGALYVTTEQDDIGRLRSVGNPSP